MHGQWSNPVYAEPNGKPQIIFPGGDGWIHAFNPKNGELLWKFDCNPKDSVYELGGEGTRNDFVCHAGRLTRTSCTSASARTPSTTRASATCGASTSPRSRRTRTRTCRRQRPEGRPTSSTRRTRRTRTPAWSGTTAATHPKPANGRDYYFGRTLSTCCRPRRPVSTRPSTTASCTASTPRPARSTGSTT